MTEFPLNHIEISASDPKAAADFYSAVFGWKIEVEETMDYVQFMPQADGIGGAFTQATDTNPAGTVVPYVTTDDIDASLEKASANGGTVVMGKTEIPGFGHFGVFKDPTGNMVGLFSGTGPEA